MALLALFLVTVPAGAHAGQKSAAKKAAHRANELTLAGLRPGKDHLQQAKKLYGTPSRISATESEDGVRFQGNCTSQLLRVDTDRSGMIQQIILTTDQQPNNPTETLLSSKCAETKVSWPYKGLNIAHVEFKWKTGHNVALGSDVGDLARIYGQPDSRSPSTKDGQPLELWYYAFDRAGPDVPQVMEVLCTKEKDGEPGRVVEITLAAPSL
jgi:hypothetical protein